MKSIQKFFLLFALLFVGIAVSTLQAQPTSGPGIDPNALLIMDFEEGSIAGWTTNTINRGEKNSVELMDAEKGDPVRFGRYAVKLNWDFTAAEENTTLASLYSPPANAFEIPAAPNPRTIGMWIYASPECRNNIWFRLQLFSPPGAAGSGSSVNAAFGNEPSYANINWEGWKYHEFTFPAEAANKKLGPPQSTTPSYGVFRLLQEKSGTGGRQLTKGYFIIDNVRVTTASEDITKPSINSLKGNNVNLANANFTTGNVDFSATYSDNLSGINVASALFTVNGVIYKAGNAGFTANETTASLTGLNLRNGTHTVVFHVEDKFGNIQTQSATFNVNDPEAVTTTISLVPDAEALVGNQFEMKINTNNSTDIKALDITIELNQFASVNATTGVSFGSSVTNGEFTYNPANHQLTINIENDHTVAQTENLATIKVDISKNSNPDDVLRVSPVLSTVTFADDYNTSFTLFSAFSRPVKAHYNIKALKRIMGVPGEILVTDLNDNPVTGATVYGGSAQGTTGANGVATVNFTSAVAGVNVYAAKDGKYSYTHIVRVLEPKLTAVPSAIRSGTTVDPSTSKTIVWMANPATALEPSIMKIAKKSDGESAFVEHTGITKILEFDAVASSGIVKGSKVTVTGLQPATEYIYKVGDGTNWTPTREFTTTSNTSKFTFSAFGDYQATGAGDKTHWLAAAQTLSNLETKPFFSLNVGDIVDNDSRWDYHSHYSSIFDDRPVFANIDMVSGYGNHEYMGTVNAEYIKFLNGHPQIEPSTKYNIDIVGDGSYYAVYGNMLVITLDWESKGQGYSAPQRQNEQVKWLREVLENHKNLTWKVIDIHYEIPNTNFTPGSMATLGPVLDEYGVNISFCGHGHTFRRVQVKGGTWTPSNYTRTAAPVEGAGTMHWQLGGLRPSDGNNQRWVMGEVDGNTINFTVRDGSNNVVTNECFTLTSSVTGDEIVMNDAAEIKIFPNPVSEYFSISGAENALLQVTDLTGTVVYSQRIGSSLEYINTEKLTAGVYFIQVEKDKQVKVSKIIKQ